MKSRLFFLSLVIVVFIATPSFAAEKVILQLNWRYQFEFAGYIVAKEKGFYKNVGLNVVIKEYNGGDVVQDVLDGKADFGVAGTELFVSILEKKPIVLLANFFKKSPLVLAVKPTIFTPQDLNGKILLCGGSDIRFTSLGLLFDKFHIHFKKIVKVKGLYDLTLFLKGKVDAVPIYVTNQLYLLNKLGVEYNLIEPSNYGIFAYAGNLFTSRRFLRRHPSIVESFVEATIKGWRYALSHPKEIAHIIHMKYHPHKSLNALFYEAKKIRSVMMPSIYPIGFIDIHVVRKILREFAYILNKPMINNVMDFIYKMEAIGLTQQELNFIASHRTVKICVNPGWEPIEFFEKRRRDKGVALRIMAKALSFVGMNYVVVPTKGWNESLRYLKSGKCDLMPDEVRTYSLSNSVLFTKPYISYNLFIFSKSSSSFMLSLKNLKGKYIVEEKNSPLFNLIKENYPFINLIPVGSMKEVFAYVNRNDKYCTVSILPVATYYLKKFDYSDISIIGSLKSKYEARVAVRKDIPILRDIITKALEMVSQREKEKIWSSELGWVASEKYHERLARNIAVLAFISLVIIVLLLWVIKLFARKNRELVEVKRSLEESLRNFEILSRHSLQMVIILKDNVCIDVNETMCDTLGYKREELLGRSIFEIVAKECLNVLKEKIKIEHTQPYELCFRKKDGTLVYSIAKGDNIVMNGERVRLSTAVDITELKMLQKKLEEINKYLKEKIKEETEKNLVKDRMIMQQSKFAAMGEMMSMIAHQWRQPLNAISATVNNLILKIKIGDYDEEVLSVKLRNILEYIKHLSETIDDFRDFFGPTVTKEIGVIDDAILQVVRIVKDYVDSKNINMILDLHCKRKVLLNYNELKHVILNLINNSRDAIVERGVKDPFIKISTHCDGEEIILRVEDNGGGIEEGIVDKIFDPYFTTKGSKKGTGLGLYMSKIMIEEHMNGSITAANTDKGAVFEIRLPIIVE